MREVKKLSHRNMKLEVFGYGCLIFMIAQIVAVSVAHIPGKESWLVFVEVLYLIGEMVSFYAMWLLRTENVKFNLSFYLVCFGLVFQVSGYFLPADYAEISYALCELAMISAFFIAEEGLVRLVGKGKSPKAQILAQFGRVLSPYLTASGATWLIASVSQIVLAERAPDLVALFSEIDGYCFFAVLVLVVAYVEACIYIDEPVTAKPKQWRRWRRRKHGKPTSPQTPTA